MPARRDYLARYLAGEHAAWDELVAHADVVAQQADLRAEALAVATALMKRVRQNADTVRGTLRAAGARLTEEHDGFSPEILARAEDLGGTVPVALEAFWRTCGSLTLLPIRYDYGVCDLEREGLSLLALDPLALCSVSDIEHNLDEYDEEYGNIDDELVEPFTLDLAPDFLHKQDISGGPAYAVELPTASDADALDPPILYARHSVRLVGYLRHAFRWGGFPLLEIAHTPVDEMGLNERIAYENVTGDVAAAAERLLGRLRAGLVDF